MLEQAWLFVTSLKPCGKPCLGKEGGRLLWAPYGNNLSTSSVEFMHLYIVNIYLVFQLIRSTFSSTIRVIPGPYLNWHSVHSIMTSQNSLCFLQVLFHFLLVLEVFLHGKIPMHLWSSFTDLAFPHLVNLFLHYWLISSLDIF